MVIMTDDVAVEKEEKPDGADFFVELPDGHKVWFRDFKDGQRLMLIRAHESLVTARDKVHASDLPDADKYRELAKLSERGDKRLWNAIDSITLNPADIDLIMDAMIIGAIDIDWAWKVMARGRPLVEPDDAEEVKPAKPSRRANAKRSPR